jgi:putative hemolysin
MKTKTLILTAILGIFLAGGAQALINPAAAYCNRLGYEQKMVDTAAGTTSYCVLPGGLECEEWDFAEGKCGIEYSYCARKGYKSQTSEEHDKCKTLGSDCLLCITPDGTELEATKASRTDTDIGPVQSLQDLIPEEPTTTTVKDEPKPVEKPVCGDGVCELGEKCPTDCDALPQDTDLTPIILWSIVGVVVIVIVVAAIKKGQD